MKAKTIYLIGLGLLATLLGGCETTAPTVAEAEPVSETGPAETMEEFRARERIERAQQERIDESERRKRMDAVVAAHPDWNAEVADAVRGNHVVAGMPTDAFEIVWGKPSSKTVSGGYGAATETWFYRKTDYRMDSFYFVNGKLVRWTIDQ